ncbi:MAG TPA: PH domain-containing protein [Pirellulales bacterium]|nr:PH domain-containing protein [Pirellulales bacterium]
MLFAEDAEILYPRKAKWYVIFVFSLAFSAGGYAMAALLPGRNHTVGYAVCALFGLLAATSFLVLVPGSSFVRITPEGLSIRTLWRNHHYRWADIERFGVAEVTTVHKGVAHRHRMVGFNFSEFYQASKRKRRAISWNERLCGFQAALPDNYGWNHADLAEHLNELLDRYGRM